MSRYPFRECVNEVMSKYRGNRAKSTLEIMERRYNRMEKDLNLLRSEGRISTTSPKHLTVDDIAAYHEFLRDRLVNGGHVCNDSIKKDFIDLNKLCAYYGNRCIEDYKARCPALSSRKSCARLPVLQTSEIDRILSLAAKVPDSDLSGLRAYGMFALCTGAGLRTVEAVNAKVSNIVTNSDGSGKLVLENGQEVTFSKTMTMKATAYTTGDPGVGTITASGSTVHLGTVGVDRSQLPFGTKMYIVTSDGSYVYGFSIAEDTGGAIRKNRIDLYHNTYNDCIQFGVRNCTVYILD